MPSPQNGGCWYCEKQDNDLAFSVEFDTFVHLHCIEDAAKDPKDREAAIMAREFDVPQGRL